MDGSRSPACDSRGEGKRLQPRGPECACAIWCWKRFATSFLRIAGTRSRDDRDFHDAFLPSDSSAPGEQPRRRPGVPVDFRFPEDALEQLRRARAFISGPFWKSSPRPLAVRRIGFGRHGRARRRRRVSNGWRPTKAFSRSPACTSTTETGIDSISPTAVNNITIFFRDRTLSDLIGFHYMHGAAARQRAGSPAQAQGNSGRFACLHHSRWRESLGLLPGQRPRFPAIRF